MRLFVAINLPEHVRRAVWDAAADVRAQGFPIRWVAPDSIHLTLKFLGDVPAEREREISRAVRSAAEGGRQFVLPIEGFGAFPSAARPRVVWVGCDAVAPLELLQHRVERVMERLGYPLEGRPFRPHLTLGRAKRTARAGDFDGFAAALAGVTFSDETTVRSVDLMMSELGRQGAKYSVRYAAELAEC